MTSSAPPAHPQPNLPADIQDVSVAVVTVNYRTPDLTKNCLAALAAEKGLLPNLKAIVVDGGSGDGSAAELAAFVARQQYASWVSFLPLELNGGFAWANNQAILNLARESSPPDLVHLLNPDAEITPGAVAHLAAELHKNPRCGAVGSQLFDEAGKTAASAFRFPSAGREFVSAAQSGTLGSFLGIAPMVIESARSCEADWVTGASVMFRAAALRQTGLFDDGFFLYYEEVQLMHRLKAAGWSVRFVPESRVVHHEGSATGITTIRALPPYWYESRRRYYLLTGGPLALLTADLGYLAGDGLRRAKSLVGRRSPATGFRVRELARAIWRQAKPSVPAWGDAPGAPPAWMSKR
jgi:GT2 family glycosyltransferase